MSTELLNANKTTEAKDIVKLQAYRLKNGNGIGIFVQSELFENFIRSNAANPDVIDGSNKAHFNTSTSPGWSAHMGYKLIPKDELKHLNLWGQTLINGPNANISFLTAKGLKNGLTFEFEGMYSQTTVENFLMSVKRQLKSIYSEYIKEKNWTLTATIREIE